MRYPLLYLEFVSCDFSQFQNCTDVVSCEVPTNPPPVQDIASVCTGRWSPPSPPHPLPTHLQHRMTAEERPHSRSSGVGTPDRENRELFPGDIDGFQDVLRAKRNKTRDKTFSWRYQLPRRITQRKGARFWKNAAGFRKNAIRIC